MKLAIFDLDNTLLGGDSDYLWGQFLVELGVVDGAHYARENQRFYDEYARGVLDIHEFLRFSLQPLAANPLPELLAWRDRFMAEKIRPILLPKARELVEAHRADGAYLMIITATNRFVTELIAREFGVHHLIATEPEQREGRFTGEVAGVPSFKQGKVERLEAWLRETGRNLADSSFYSDSHNDLPLLELVTHPVAVDPDETLRQHAEFKGWPILSLREAAPAEADWEA